MYFWTFIEFLSSEPLFKKQKILDRFHLRKKFWIHFFLLKKKIFWIHFCFLKKFLNQFPFEKKKKYIFDHFLSNKNESKKFIFLFKGKNKCLLIKQKSFFNVHDVNVADKHFTFYCSIERTATKYHVYSFVSNKWRYFQFCRIFGFKALILNRLLHLRKKKIGFDFYFKKKTIFWITFSNLRKNILTLFLFEKKKKFY